MTCKFANNLDAYVDGELDSGSAAAIEAHVAQCPPCLLEIADLQALRSLFARTELAPLSAGGMHRLHEHADGLLDQKLVWVARVLSGIAASVLIAGALWMTQAEQPAPRPIAATFDPVRVIMSVEQAPTNAADVKTPEWVVADLSGRTGDE